MDVLTKDLLVNFLLMILPLLFIQIVYFYSYRNRLQKKESKFAAIFPAISILLCLSFPFTINEGFLWDLRAVPIVLGTLYGGYRMGIFLTAVALISRAALGGDGVLVSTITLLLIWILYLAFMKQFQRSKVPGKIMIGTLLVSFLVLCNLTLSYLIFNVLMPLDVWVTFTIINIVGLIVAMILWEIIRTNFLILNDLIRAEKLSVVSHLAASISHEVRNPLTVSRGFIQMALQDRGQDERQDYYLYTALKEIDHATDIINDYLTFAKPASDQQDIIRIKEELTHSVNVIQPLANMNHVDIHLHDQLPENALLLAEKKQFQQSLINIFKNGIEAMPDGGVLTISISSDSKGYVLCVADQGHGMSDEEVNRLGEPYFSTKEKGTGLGLMVSYSIIKAIGGSVKVSSVKNHGTTFEIFLPVYRER
ncbi:histidine kinase [Jeotgalibacillus malaysiensis]|uniref:histidine kinase n=1 Tax=Jeotgalibacillus malaysiensis TaxID=1508404 RepID=A0A0B5ARR5_9BACL|nr:ATP-binding protein [Jeotgalibacillus malaysiensis]AJD90759.1 histidine kinase [Jeotgalibacillus malaysiensis]